MDKKEFFRVDDKSIYIRVVLVDFNLLPIFSICEDDSNNSYLALSIDENLFYLGRSSRTIIKEMLDKKTFVKNAFLESSDFWLIEMGDSVEDDVVKSISKSDIKEEHLPVENFYYEICSDDVREYLNSL